MTTSLNTPAPEQSRDLQDAIEAAQREYGEATERTVQATDDYNEAINTFKPYREVDGLWNVLVERITEQAQAWHRLDEAKAALLAAQN